MSTKRALVIAVDGPAASGKGTLGKKLAGHFGLPHLDTGLLYRAVGKKCLQAGKTDSETATEAAKSLNVSDLVATGLHSEEIGQAASVISAIPEVRAALLDYQRQFAAQDGGAVLDGRDIGTVICPHADVKLFITASPEVRAERRFKQQSTESYEAILEAIVARDARDSNRSAAPLKAADDAIMLDTSAMNANEVFAAALKAIEITMGR